MAIPPPQILGLTDWRALARGGFATVWQAKQESLNRLVAVKVDQRPLDTETEQRRFLREAGAAGRMSGHPGIVTVHDAGILSDARPYLVMELCPGGSLTAWLKAEARPDQRRIRDVGVRIADALAAAHARGVLHRDVKPANILIDAYEHPGLADFGLAAMPDAGMELSDTLEAITPAYAPPEAFEQKPATEYGDVYSLAATLYALLSGHPPRGRDGPTPTLAENIARLKDPIAPIPGVDAGLMAVLTTALAEEPTERLTAAQFRDQLAAVDLDPAPVVAPPVVAEPESGSAAGPSAPTDGTTPPPPVNVTAVPPSEVGGDRRRRRSRLVLAAVIAILVTGLIVGVVNNGAGTAVGQSPATTAVSASAGSPSASSETPTPTPSAPLPPGFVDCSTTIGDDGLCRTAPECWAGIIQFADVPAVATAEDCSENHVYQTYAGGVLDYEVRRQSRLEADERVKAVCRKSVVNSMLNPADRTSAWEIIALPPQDEDENFYRCIFGSGDHTGAYQLS